MHGLHFVIIYIDKEILTRMPCISFFSYMQKYRPQNILNHAPLYTFVYWNLVHNVQPFKHLTWTWLANVNLLYGISHLTGNGFCH